VPGKTTATIDRERRDALYELVLDHLSGIGDFWIAVEEKDFAKAERLGIEYGEDFRLLEDIGWAPEHGGATVVLTLPPHDLIELLRRLHGEAGCVLEGSACARLLGEGRRERKAALRARQDHLRATDRAARPPPELRRDQRLSEGRGSGHREGTQPDGWAASLPRPSVSRSRRSFLVCVGERPVVRSGGRAVHPEGEDQQSQARLT
jgi:hypothetical protein